MTKDLMRLYRQNRRPAKSTSPAKVYAFKSLTWDDRGEAPCDVAERPYAYENLGMAGIAISRHRAIELCEAGLVARCDKVNGRAPTLTFNWTSRMIDGREVLQASVTGRETLVGLVIEQPILT